MSTSMLSVESVQSGYGQSEVIRGVSIDARANEIIALMGLNGMGKTTLMKTLIGILPLRKGAVKIEGRDLSQKRPYERVREGLAYVPQGRMVFPKLTVEENIKTGLQSDREPVPEELYDLFPVLREMRHRKGGNLSGGQQQQLVIARALASKPRVLLLDEPTEGIQPSIIKELGEVLKRIRTLKGLTILVSEQVLSFALAVADRVLVMERGKLVHESLRDRLDEQALGRLLSI